MAENLPDEFPFKHLELGTKISNASELIFPPEIPQVGQKVRITGRDEPLIIESTIIARYTEDYKSKELIWISLAGVQNLKDICYIIGHPAWTGLNRYNQVIFLKIEVID